MIALSQGGWGIVATVVFGLGGLAVIAVILALICGIVILAAFAIRVTIAR